MTITTASKINSDQIKVISKRHKFFLAMPGEKRAVLTRGKTIELYRGLQQIENIDSEWNADNFDRLLAAPADEPVVHNARPVYAVSIFEKKHSGEDLKMLQAWLKDALFGSSDHFYSQVAFLKRTRKAAEELFADLV